MTDDLEDGGYRVWYGGGWLRDPAVLAQMSPERAELERAAAEREAEAAAEELDGPERERAADQAFWAARHGVTAEPYNPYRRITELFGEAVDRREAARLRREHSMECGCDACGERLVGSGYVAPLPESMASKLKKSQANIAALESEPATKGDLKKLSGAIAHAKALLFAATGKK